MTDIRLLAFSGSLRRDSFNHTLVQFAAGQARELGAEVDVIRLRDLDLPVLDEDWERENGLPAGAVELKGKLAAAQGMLIASPEYNGFPSGALKNAIDWCTRKGDADEAPLAAFRGKVAGLMATSPGALGGVRGLPHLRTLLSGIGVTVVPAQLAVGKAHEVFDADGRLTDERAAGGLRALVEDTIRHSRALHA